ncbi:MAG: hypothetical protein AAGK04_05005 [Planctomycetota bacterium]
MADVGDMKVKGLFAGKPIDELTYLQIQKTLKKAGWKIAAKANPQPDEGDADLEEQNQSPSQKAKKERKRIAAREARKKRLSFIHALWDTGPQIGVRTLNGLCRELSRGFTKDSATFAGRQCRWFSDQSGYVVFDPKKRLLITIRKPNSNEISSSE